MNKIRKASLLIRTKPIPHSTLQMLILKKIIHSIVLNKSEQVRGFNRHSNLITFVNDLFNNLILRNYKILIIFSWEVVSQLAAVIEKSSRPLLKILNRYS